jgi:hypothetical protein
VGIIATLAVLLGRVVLFPGGSGAISWPALAIAFMAWLALTRTRLALPWILAGAAAAGLSAQALGAAW